MLRADTRRTNEAALRGCVSPQGHIIRRPRPIIGAHVLHWDYSQQVRDMKVERNKVRQAIREGNVDYIDTYLTGKEWVY